MPILYPVFKTVPLEIPQDAHYVIADITLKINTHVTSVTQYPDVPHVLIVLYHVPLVLSVIINPIHQHVTFVLMP